MQLRKLSQTVTTCMAVVITVALTSSLTAPFASAQETTARVTGVVTDASGAAVPDAKIVVTSVDRHTIVSTLIADKDGNYTAQQLQPGMYSFSIEAPGFKKNVVSNIQLAVAQRLSLDLKLSIGDASEVVDVSAGARPQLESGSATVSTLITSSELKDLPLPNRDTTALFALVPGAVHGGSATNVNAAQVSFNGSRTLNTEVLLDGNSVVNGATGNINRLPSPDFLSEFRVISSNAPAEYGRTSGAVVTIGSRAGTSLLHGGIYELFRNEGLNANSYFNKLNRVRRPINHYNQFGFTIGGPIWIPRLYQHKDRAFFYLNYDQTLSQTPGTATLTIPQTAFRVGDFSSSSVTIRDPNTGAPFPGNRIPTNRIDSASQAILAALPDPVNTGSANNYYTQQKLRLQQPRYSVRFDQSFSSKANAFVSVTRQIAATPQVIALNSLLNSSYAKDADQGWAGAGGLTYVFTPTLVMTLGGGASRDADVRLPSSFGQNPITSLSIGTAPANFTPQINITNYSSLGTAAGSYSQTYYNGFTYFGSITKLAGSHTLKTGALLKKNELNIFNPGVQPGGAYNFNGEITSITGVGGNQINALADFELGKIKTSSYGLPQPANGRRNYNLGAFVQDDYKANAKLLLNVGLRWEYESPQTISNDLYSRLDSQTGQLLVANKTASRTLNLTTPKLDFAPRIGLIYSATNRTVVRAAYGNFYGLIFANLGGQVGYPGYEGVQSFNNLGTQVAQPFTLSQGMPLIGVRDLNNPGAAIAAATASAPYIPASTEFGKLNPLSLQQQWSAGVQQDLFAHTVIEIAYVGSHGVHLPLVLNGNLPDPSQATAVAYANTTLATQNARPFPKLGAIPAVWNVGTSNYHSLQLTGRRQFSSSIAFLTSYTWAHSIDDGSGVYNYSQPNGLNGGQYPSISRSVRERSNSAYDLRHNFTFAGQFTSHGPWWSRNFQFNPIVSLRTGLPLTVTQSNLFPGVSDAQGSTRASQRPNGTTEGIKTSFRVEGTGVRALLAPTAPNFPLSPSGPLFVGSGAARTQVLAAGLGNLGRYSLRSPGEMNVDASVSRTFHVFEKVNVQLRLDAFNLFNHTNFLSPNTALSVTTNSAGLPVFSAPNFGLITASAPARFMQLVTRINF